MRAPTLVLALLLLPTAASAGQRPWAVCAAAGAGVPVPSNRVTTRGTLTIGLERAVWGRLGVSLSGRLGLAEIATDLAVEAGPSLRLAEWRGLRLLAVARAGYAAIHVDKLGRTLWTGALLLSPGIEASYALGGRLELRAAPLGFTLFHNEIWVPSWEPRLGLALRF